MSFLAFFRIFSIFKDTTRVLNNQKLIYDKKIKSFLADQMELIVHFVEEVEWGTKVNF